MNPQPLDLEEIWQIIEDVFIKHYEERICDVSNVDLKSEVKRCYCDVLLENLRKKKYEIKQRLKSACEFYLRYRDKPGLFSEEQFTIYWEYDDEIGCYLIDLGNKYVEYNGWLFRLAFKNVLEEVEK